MVQWFKPQVVYPELIDFNSDSLSKKLEKNLALFKEHRSDEASKLILSILETSRNLLLLKMGYSNTDIDNYYMHKGKLSCYNEIINDLGRIINTEKVTPQVKSDVRGQVKRPRHKSMVGAANW